MQVTANFNSVLDHMHCPCCNAFHYDKTFMKRIQILRDLVEKPFCLDRKGGGFYRCRIYNNSLPNPAKNSRHLYGDAMDISSHGWDGNTKWFFVEQAMALGMSVGIYKSWFHVDLRPGKPVLFYGS